MTDAFGSAATRLHMLERREVSSREPFEHHLDRIDRHDSPSGSHHR
jgi:hypothetical protein